MIENATYAGAYTFPSPEPLADHHSTNAFSTFDSIMQFLFVNRFTSGLQIGQISVLSAGVPDLVPPEGVQLNNIAHPIRLYETF